MMGVVFTIIILTILCGFIFDAVKDTTIKKVLEYDTHIFILPEFVSYLNFYFLCELNSFNPDTFTFANIVFVYIDKYTELDFLIK